jgi:hypothetical protein
MLAGEEEGGQGRGMDVRAGLLGQRVQRGSGWRQRWRRVGESGVDQRIDEHPAQDPL